MKILLVDDHALFREGLCLLLRELTEDVCVLEAGTADSAFAALSGHDDIDLMLLDLNIPGSDGFSILDAASSKYPTLPITVLSASGLQEDVDRVMATSAMGYIHKDTTSKVMLGAIRLILAGGIYTPPPSVLFKGTLAQEEEGTLTTRQVDVLRLLVDGDSNKHIASKLGLAEATIKMHVTSIFRTLGVKNRTQAALAGRALV
jgi:DNA-binding NarL/FixJ family response regulator